MSVYERLLEIQRESGLPPYLFAESIGTRKTFFTELKSGRIQAPGAATLLRLNEKYRVNLHWLLTGEGEKYRQRQEQMTDAQKADEEEFVHLMRSHPAESIMLLSLPQARREDVFALIRALAARHAPSTGGDGS